MTLNGFINLQEAVRLRVALENFSETLGAAERDQDMKPVLGTISIEKLNDESTPHNYIKFDFVSDLPEDEFARYRQASADLNNFITDAQLFEIVVLNYQEYYATLKAQLDAFIQRGKEYFDSRRFVLT